MYKIGDYVVYNKDVCVVNDMVLKDNKKYYLLLPVEDPSLKMQVLVDNENIRGLITMNELNDLINNIPNIETITCDEKMLEYEYKQLLSNGSKEDIIKVIKTTYLRNKDRILNKKKINLKDSEYLEKAEKLLYTEIGIVLNLTFEEVKKFIIKKVEELVA